MGRGAGRAGPTPLSAAAPLLSLDVFAGALGQNAYALSSVASTSTGTTTARTVQWTGEQICDETPRPYCGKFVEEYRR